jgi:hypothetical protein
MTADPQATAAHEGMLFEKFDPDLQGEQESLEKEARRLLETRTIWPGNWCGIINWREVTSWTIMQDYLGSTELIASVRSIYSGMLLAMLDALAQLGFNTDSYRDKDGRLTINAEKIESLVVGDKIDLKQNPASELKSDTANKAA